MHRTGVVLLQPGYISRYEASGRVGAVLAGLGVECEPAGAEWRVLSAGRNGRVKINWRMQQKLGRVPGLEIRLLMEAESVEQGEILATFRLLDSFIPEERIRYWEALAAETGCLLDVEAVSLQKVLITAVGAGKLSGLFVLESPKNPACDR